MRKILYGVNVTDDKTNVYGDEVDFISQRINNEQEKKIEECLNKVKNSNSNKTLDRRKGYSKRIFLIVWLFILAGIIAFSRQGDTLEEAILNAPWVFVLLTLAYFVWLIIYIKDRKKTKVPVKTDEFKQIEDEIDEIIEESFGIMEVPSDALKIDVLSFRYKIRNGEIKTVSSGMSSFINLEKRFYVKGNELYIADWERIISLRMDSLKETVKVDAKVSIPMWNKTLPVTDEIFKPFNLKVNTLGYISFKDYYVLYFEQDQHTVELYIPEYDKGNIDKLLK